MPSPEHNLKALDIALPEGSAPAANYTNAVRTGNLLYIAGKAPQPIKGKLPKGRLGQEFTLDDGYDLARSACIELIAVMKTDLGDLNRVTQIVEVQGFVNAAPDFEGHAQVMDGASDLLVSVFAENGIHARSVLGASSLRNGIPIVLKAIVEFSD